MQGRRILRHIIVAAAVFTATFTSAANAGVVEGRQYLFNNGSPTYSGILAANTEFQTVLATNPANQQANLFYAVTRILAFGLENGNGPALETLRDVYEAFGITRSTEEFLDSGSPIDMPPDVNGHYVPPENLPDGDVLRDFLAGPFLTLLSDAVGNLDKINTDFTTIISTQETGDAAVAVDYHDVLIVKSLLLCTKALIEFIAAYDLDSIDIRNLVVLNNAGMLQLQRDILDRYEKALSLRIGDGTAHLLNVWDTLNHGIDAYGDAYNFIKGRWDVGDFREEHLFSFESQDDLDVNGDLVTEMTKVQRSIEEGGIADFTKSEVWIYLYDQSWSNWLSLSINRESGEITNSVLNGQWDFLAGSPVLDGFAITGSSITMNISDTDSNCTAVYTGVIEDAQQSGYFYTYVNGHFDTSNCSGASFVTANGSYSGRGEGQLLNFNRIFGTNDQPALDIRAVLPEFDTHTNAVAGSFPPVDGSSPVLNGLLPNLLTNADLTEELELQASGFADIKQGTKVVDGNFADWDGDTPVLQDESGDGCTSVEMEDVIDVYLAKDSENLYIATTFPADGQESDGYITFHMGLRRSVDSWNEDVVIQASSSDAGSTWSVTVFDRYYNVINTYGSSNVGVSSGLGEVRVPLVDIYSALGSLSGTYLTASMGCDYNSTNIRLDTGELTGTIAIPDAAYNGPGKIFLSVFDSPDHNYGSLLGSTYLELSTPNYTIKGLTISPDNVYLSAWWDRDNNGVPTEEDYWWAFPVVVASRTTTLNIDLQSVLVEDHLQDTLTVLRVLAGMNPLGLESVPDINANGKIDMAEALSSLRQAAELNQE